MTRRRVLTPREVEQCRIVARDYPAGTRETVLNLVDTIEDLRRKLEEVEYRTRFFKGVRT